MEQLNLFSNENLNITSKKTKKEKFDFDKSLDKIEKINKKISIFCKNRLDDNEPTPLNLSLSLGKELKLLYENKPFIIKDNKEISIFDYLNDFDYFDIYIKIREYEVYELLKNTGFKVLPKDNYILSELDKYTDNQIIEIWKEVLKATNNPNQDNVIDTIKSLKKIKPLNKIIHSNLSYAYKDSEHNVYLKNTIEMFEYHSEERKKLETKIRELEEQLAFAYSMNSIYSNKNNNPTKSPYDVLGINKNSSQEDIKKAFRKLSSDYHSDKIVYLKDYVKDPNQFIQLESMFNEKFKEVKTAYETLN